MIITTRTIEAKANEIAIKYSDKKKKYIDVEEIADRLGLKVEAHDLGANVSGALYIEKGKGRIGYNENESSVRRRFTIAHEIGHYILHRLDNEIFVDKMEFKVLYRNDDSATGNNKRERQANAFAAALLMPKERLLKELKKLPFDLGDDQDNCINTLAKIFQVSTQAMTFRISNLNLF